MSRFAAISVQASLMLDGFATAQVADIASTQWGLTIRHLHEVNPVMAWCMTEFGTLWWWLPKLAIVLFAAYAAPRLRRVWPLGLATWITAGLSINNLVWIL